MEGSYEPKRAELGVLCMPAPFVTYQHWTESQYLQQDPCIFFSLSLPIFFWVDFYRVSFLHKFLRKDSLCFKIVCNPPKPSLIKKNQQHFKPLLTLKENGGQGMTSNDATRFF